MKELAIIGTAGRREDAERLNQDVFDYMCGYAASIVTDLGPTRLISGGAAWADHVAVALFNNGIGDELVLHLPAPFANCKYQGNHWKDPGSIANYYHRSFSNKTHEHRLLQIQKAIDAGARIHVYNGFHARNYVVGRAHDYLLAFTYGTLSGSWSQYDPEWTHHELAGLKDGGTAHTWDNSRSTIKEHVNLNGI